MYLRQSPATLFARDAILEFCSPSPYLAGAVVVFVPLFVWKPSSIHKRIIVEDAWCTTIMCSSTLCGWSRDVCFFWIEMFVWVQVLKSRPIANERKWEGKEKFLLQRKKEKKLLMWCRPLSTETE